MEPRIQKPLRFVGKSLLWSLLLYTVLMLAFNWDEVNNTIRGRNSATIIHVSPSGERQIDAQPGAGALTSILAVLRTLSGVSL